MNKWTLNRFFYKTLNFWLGLAFAVLDVYSIVHRGSVNLDASLDVIGVVLSIGLILSSLVKRERYSTDKKKRSL
ncbi:hypothetical protein [Lentilactobacillus parafarraginis]|nr:hypothetical protein [Lentilactobacillus parafarraginis]